MDVFSVRVAEVQEELRQRKGINVTHVIMTSDEQDEKWWDRVHEMGWLRIDHEKANTIAVHGEWYERSLPLYPLSSLSTPLLTLHRLPSPSFVSLRSVLVTDTAVRLLGIQSLWTLTSSPLAWVSSVPIARPSLS